MKKSHYFESPVIASSGLMGIMGEGYKYHKIFKIFLPILFSFKWVTFQMKTVTVMPRVGNMKLSDKDSITPVEFRPKCIYVNFWKGFAVNNVSLSNPGIGFILETGILQKIKGELHLSVMFINTNINKLIEIHDFVCILLPELKNFQASKIFLHWNVSCPNTEHDGQKSFIEGFKREYRLLKELGLPIILKVGWNFPIDILLELQKNEMIYGIDAINTIPFHELPIRTKRKYFTKKDEDGNFISPLDKHHDKFVVKGSGGVSGNPIRSFSLSFIKRARTAGFILPIIGGGGIIWPWNVIQFKRAGATVISPGSVAFLRPFNLLLITLTAKVVFRKH